MFDAIGHFHFLRPWWLLAAPVVAGVYWVWRRQSDPLRGWRAQIDADLLQALIAENGNAQHRSARWWLIGWMLAVAALAGPTWRLEPNPFAEDAAPLMILLKASDSMVRGNASVTALERAKLKISDLAVVRKGQPLGLIAYAGSAHLVLPPTRDTGVVSQMAAEISPDVMPVPGDRLDLALQQAGDLLSSEGSGGTLLVIADSVESEAQELKSARNGSPMYAIQFLALADEGSPEAGSLVEAAQRLNATVQYLTADDVDVTRLANAAARRSLSGVGGETGRWQEAGYWLVPMIALLVALSFRREAPATGAEAT